MMKQKSTFVFVIFSLLLFLTGCWDYLDINHHGIVYVIAIDKEVIEKEHHEREGYEIEETDEKNQKEDNSKPKKQYVVTLQFIEANAIAGSEKAGRAKDAKLNITSTKADSIVGAINELNSRTCCEPLLSHTRIILIGEDLARDGITKSLDYFIRSPYIRKGTKVIITKGPAKEVLKLDHPLLTHTGFYIENIPTYANRLKQTPDIDLGKLSMHIHHGDDFLLPRMILSNAKNEIKYGGAAVFKKDKMIGWMGEREVLDWALCAEPAKHTPIDSLCPDKDDKGTFTVDIRHQKKYSSIDYKDGKIHVKVKIYIVADVRELQCHECKMLDIKETRKMEEALSATIKNRISYTCNTTRKKFEADVYGIGTIISKFHPKIWKQVEKDWDKHFKNLTYDVEVATSLRTAQSECRPDLAEN